VLQALGAVAVIVADQNSQWLNLPGSVAPHGRGVGGEGAATILESQSGP
jgi:hypothetical protein